jgi:hypothetical protein
MRSSRRCLDGAERRGERWLRLAAFGLSALFLLCGVAAVTFAFRGMLAPDFLSFWAAGRLASHGDAAVAYDMARHHSVELQGSTKAGALPFAYPPPFLFFVLPFGVLPFAIAFAAWIAITAFLYVLSLRGVGMGRYSLAQAAAAANLIIGQNGFLTAAIFIRGTDLIARRPLLAGAILGLLVIKPQLAMLLPVALLAGREWRAMLGGLISSCALLAIGLLLFGADAYRGFFVMLHQLPHWLSSGRLPWGELASPFAFLRFFGVPQTPALIAHGAVALGAAVLTARAWALKLEQRIAILAAASLLMTPYLFTYDALLLTVPLAWTMKHNQRAAFIALWLLSLLPLGGYFGDFPNTIPLAALVALWVLHRPAGGESQWQN